MEDCAFTKCRIQCYRQFLFCHIIMWSWLTQMGLPILTGLSKAFLRVTVSVLFSWMTQNTSFTMSSSTSVSYSFERWVVSGCGLVKVPGVLAKQVGLWVVYFPVASALRRQLLFFCVDAFTVAIEWCHFSAVHCRVCTVPMSESEVPLVVAWWQG